MPKNKAAVALGKLRWAGKTAEEKAAHARMMVEKRKAKAKKSRFILGISFPD